MSREVTPVVVVRSPWLDQPQPLFEEPARVLATLLVTEVRNEVLRTGRAEVTESVEHWEATWYGSQGARVFDAALASLLTSAEAAQVRSAALDPRMDRRARATVFAQVERRWRDQLVDLFAEPASLDVS